MHSPANGNRNAPPDPMTPTTIDAEDQDSGKAPSWSARRRRAPGSQQADSKWRRSMEPTGTSSAERLSSFRPTHRRSKSLANMEEFLIYNNNNNNKHDDVKLERVQPNGTAATTPCDKTSIEKLISDADKNGNITRDAQDGGGHYLFGRNNKANDDVTNRRHQPARRQTPSRHKLTQLRSLLARPFSSLTASCLLLLLATLSSDWSYQIECSLVINVSEQGGGQPTAGAARGDDSLAAAHSAHSHAHNQPTRYVIVSNATTSSRSKRASAGDSNNNNRQQRLERSAKLLEADALNYLQRYGYMTHQGGGQSSGAINLISEDSFQEAVMQFQRFAGIPETGSVDSLTVRYMQMPRCGNKDMSGKGENGKRRRRRKRRRKRYALQGSKWRRQELSYRISQYPTRFLNKKHEVDSQIERAFKIWSQVAPIDFVVKKEGRVHIDIRFANGEHGDGDPFDGPGNTLAHAYFPQYGGDAHFDDQEYWTVDSYAGTNIFQVAAHELGHSLGLGHSSVREALMAPFYQKFKPNFKLHADDVLAIQALYGERNGSGGSRGDDDDDDDNDRRPNTPTTSSTTESSVPRRRPPVDEADFGSPSKPVDLCQDSKIDAITRTEDGNTYVFRGHHYWQIKNEGLASGSPGKIARDWDGLPGNLDAALTWSDGKTFFFKGDKYWRYFNKRREPGYPKLISVGFAGIPNNIQTAFVWSGNGKTYFFKGDKYWRFDSKQEPPVSGQYPKPVKNWVGLPASNIDAAFKWENGMTYFFKDDLYYRFDDREFEVDTSARPAFPRSTSEWWFGCTNSNLPIRKAPASDDMETSQSQAPEPTLLLFHRRSSASGPDSSSGTSLTRSIFSSLSALFPSSSSSTSSTSNDNERTNSSEWSFHRGLGEEVRRLTKLDRGGQETSDASRPTSRWFFPLGSSQSGGATNNRNFGEQSLSELRMMTNSSSS